VTSLLVEVGSNTSRYGFSVENCLKKVRDNQMRLAIKVLTGSIIILALVVIWNSLDSASAESPEIFTESTYSLQTTNYCQSCHSTGDERIVDATAWSGGINRAASSPCPAVKTIGEELYYTERMLLTLDRGLSQLPASADTTSLDAKLSSATQTYSRLLDSPVTSLDAFVSEAQVLRFRLGKIYAQLNQMLDQQKQTRVVLFAGVVTLILLISLAWGWRNAQKMSAVAGITGTRFSTRPTTWIFVLLVFVLFSLPIFRGATQEITETSVEQQEQQTVLDNALRSSDTADRELARSWMLARVAAAQYSLDPERAVEDFNQALSTAADAQQNSFVIWGKAKSAQEAAAGEWAAEGKAVYITSQLDAIRSRAWGLQQIAETWISVDPQKSAEILEQALEVAQESVGLYYDLDARNIAVTYAQLDVERSLEIIQTVTSLSIKAWGLREIAATTRDAAILELAGKTARQIPEPVESARALRKLGEQTGEDSYFMEAKQVLLGIESQDAALAFAWSDLIASSGETSWVEQIDPTYPTARVFAWLANSQFEQAWSESEKISDPFERAKAQAKIASQWGNPERAEMIQIPVLRDRAMRNVSIKQRDVSLVKEIENVYYSVQALTSLGDYANAAALALELDDKYPLVQLVEFLAQQDVQAALPLVELMDREADKAQALRALAVSSGDRDIFVRALSMALAARIRGDYLAPSLASLALGIDLMDSHPDLANQAFAQAFEIAGRMVIKYE
jgi:hypothetical protein